MNTSAGWPDFDGFFGVRNESNADFYILQLDNYRVEGRLRTAGSQYFTVTSGTNAITPNT